MLPTWPGKLGTQRDRTAPPPGRRGGRRDDGARHCLRRDSGRLHGRADPQPPRGAPASHPADRRPVHGWGEARPAQGGGGGGRRGAAAGGSRSDARGRRRRRGDRGRGGGPGGQAPALRRPGARGRPAGPPRHQYVVAFARALGKEPILVNDSPGFASSRLGLALGLEAMRMLEQGVATAEDIDKAMELGYNHPMGPLQLTDLVGLDVRLAIAEYLYRTLEEPQFEPPAILREKVAKGELGKKAGKGFYRWS